METPILKALNAVMQRAPNSERPPLVMGQGSGFLTNTLSASGAGSSQERLNAMGSVGWLFAVIERISTSLASTEWKLYARRGSDMTEIEEHPLIDLWREPNPFYSLSEFIEDSSNHFELVGEMSWIIVRGMGGAIVELWPVRPDRIRPIPSKDNYISGYIYQIGTTEVPLENEDVIFMRRPHPTNPYRGIGQVQSIIHDLESEQLSSAWQKNFFTNSALPGGIIEFDHNLSEQDFSRLVERWREQHQGISNSHRVAILERGKWTDRKYTQRDMEFKETRALNRDIILGAYGFPHALLGISEDVNRANAEAAEVTFARWLIRPRLVRIRDKVNQTLVSQFGDNLYLDFVDPVPADKEQALNSGERGYVSGILTQNEARERLGEGAVDGGDDFKQEPESNPIAPLELSITTPTKEMPASVQQDATLIADSTVNHEESFKSKAEDNDPLLPTLLEYAEAEMQKGWTRRLQYEMLSLISDLSSSVNIRPDGNATIETTVFDSHDWDWETRYGDDVRAELTNAYDAALKTEGYMESTDPTMRRDYSPDDTEQKIEFTEPITHSIVYARKRAAELLTLGGAVIDIDQVRRGETLIQSTQRRVRLLVAQTIEQRESVQHLASALRSDFMFSRSRADMIARTETATALGDGAMLAAKTQGRDEKMWVTQGDDAVDRSPCRANSIQGWIKMTEPFQSGHDTIPAHPRCRCNVRYRTGEFISLEDLEELPKTIDEARCQGRYRGKSCNKLLQKNYIGGTLYCSRCKQETTFETS